MESECSLEKLPENKKTFWRQWKTGEILPRYKKAAARLGTGSEWEDLFPYLDAAEPTAIDLLKDKPRWYREDKE